MSQNTDTLKFCFKTQADQTFFRSYFYHLAHSDEIPILEEYYPYLSLPEQVEVYKAFWEGKGIMHSVEIEETFHNLYIYSEGRAGLSYEFYECLLGPFLQKRCDSYYWTSLNNQVGALDFYWFRGEELYHYSGPPHPDEEHFDEPDYESDFIKKYNELDEYDYINYLEKEVIKGNIVDEQNWKMTSYWSPEVLFIFIKSHPEKIKIQVEEHYQCNSNSQYQWEGLLENNYSYVWEYDGDKHLEMAQHQDNTLILCNKKNFLFKEEALLEISKHSEVWVFKYSHFTFFSCYAKKYQNGHKVMEITKLQAMTDYLHEKQVNLDKIPANHLFQLWELETGLSKRDLNQLYSGFYQLNCRN